MTDATRPVPDENPDYDPDSPEPARGPRAGWTGARLRGVGALLVLGVVGLYVCADRLETSPNESLRTFGPLAFPAAALLGVACLAPGGVVERLKRSGRRRRRRLRPDEPWKWDHEWDPSGSSVPASARILRAATFPLWWVVLQSFFASGRRDNALLEWIPAGLVVSWWAWCVHRILGDGTAHVGFAKFPFAPGERVALRFGMSEGGADFERVAFELTRVSELPGARLSQFHVVFDELTLSPASVSDGLPGPERYVEVAFDVPAEAGGTRLSAEFPEYWSLDVEGRTGGREYRESFLVPIYGRSAA